MQHFYAYIGHNKFKKYINVLICWLYLKNYTTLYIKVMLSSILMFIINRLLQNGCRKKRIAHEKLIT